MGRWVSGKVRWSTDEGRLGRWVSEDVGLGVVEGWGVDLGSGDGGDGCVRCEGRGPGYVGGWCEEGPGVWHMRR